eukprot:4760121-Amphidinium_carterae.1
MEGSKSQVMSGTRAGMLDTWVYVIALQQQSGPFYPPWFTDGMVSDTDGQQAEGPLNVYQAGTLIQFASILTARWVIGHNDVEGECNKRRAFGRHMSAVLGRSGFDIINIVCQKRPTAANCVGQQPTWDSRCHRVPDTQWQKSVHKLSSFLNCPISHVTPVAIHIPQTVMRPGVWDGNFQFLDTMASRPLIENRMVERLLQSLEKISAISSNAQMWIASPPTAAQIPMMAEARRLLIMGSTIEDAIAAATATVSSTQQVVKLTPASRSRPVEPTPKVPQEMGPPPTPVQRKMPKGKGGSKSQADSNCDTPTTVVIPPWKRSASASPAPKTQAAPRPKQAVPEVIAVLESNVALDWAAEDWTTLISNKQGLQHWHREALQMQIGDLEVLIKVNVCTQRASTYRCLPEAQKADQLLKGSEPLEFSCNPHDREELLHIYSMMTDASAYEWLVEGSPNTPKNAPQPAAADTLAMGSLDVPMRKKRSTGSSKFCWRRRQLLLPSVAGLSSLEAFRSGNPVLVGFSTFLGQTTCWTSLRDFHSSIAPCVVKPRTP